MSKIKPLHQQVQKSLSGDIFETETSETSDSIEVYAAHSLESHSAFSASVDHDNHDNVKDVDPDPIGTQMALLMNQNPLFSYPHSSDSELNHDNSSSSPMRCDDSRSFYPLLSSKNFRRLWDSLVYIYRSILSCRPAKRRGEEGSMHKAKVPTLYDSFIFFLKVKTGLMFLLGVGTYRVLVMILQFYLVLFFFIMGLLFDLDDLKYIVCWEYVENAWKRTQIYKKFILAYNGRGWVVSESKTQLTGYRSENLEESGNLMERSPSSALCQNKCGLEKVAPKADSRNGWRCQNIEWENLRLSLKQQSAEKNGIADDTLNHLMAMNFCYIMLHGRDGKPVASQSSNKRNHEETDFVKNIETLESLERPASSIAVVHGDSTTGTLETYDAIELVETRGRRLKTPPSTPKNRIIVSPSTFDESDSKLPSVRKYGGRDSSLLLSNTPITRNLSDSDVHKYDVLYSNEITMKDDDSEFEYRPSKDREDLSIASTLTDTNNPNKSLIKEIEDKNMKWLDVGAKIGMRILKSEQIQKVITDVQNKNQKTTHSTDGNHLLSIVNSRGAMDDRLEKNNTGLTTDTIAKPFHAMWTAPSDLAFGGDEACFESNDSECFNSFSDMDDLSSSLDDITIGLQTPFIRRKQIVTSSTRSPARDRIGTVIRERHTRVLSSNSIGKWSISRGNDEVTNPSITSSEVLHFIPKDFDANSFLPSSMAISYQDDDHTRTPTRSRKAENQEQSRPPKQIGISRPSAIKESGRQKSWNGKRRAQLMKGCKMIVPIFPLGSYSRNTKDLPFSPKNLECSYQFATVVRSERIDADSTTSSLDFVQPPRFSHQTNCLSITVALDKSFLRNGKFAEMSFRVLDTQRHMPR